MKVIYKAHLGTTSIVIVASGMSTTAIPASIKFEESDIRLARNAAARRGAVIPNDDTIRAMLEAVVKGE